MTTDEFEQLHEAFKTAGINFLLAAAALDKKGLPLPFIIRVDDKNHNNLVRAEIRQTPEGLRYFNQLEQIS